MLEPRGEEGSRREVAAAGRTPASLLPGPEAGSPGSLGQARYLAAGLCATSVSSSVSSDCGLEIKLLLANGVSH